MPPRYETVKGYTVLVPDDERCYTYVVRYRCGHNIGRPDALFGGEKKVTVKKNNHWHPCTFACTTKEEVHHLEEKCNSCAMIDRLYAL